VGSQLDGRLRIISAMLDALGSEELNVDGKREMR